MKRALSIVLLAGLCLSIACGSKNVSLTPEEEVLAIRDSLRIMGIKSDVSLQDMDDDGILDIYIVYLSQKEMSLARRTWVFSSVTGVIAGSADHITWGTEYVYLRVLEDLYRSLVSECIRCTDAGRKEIDACIDQAWVKVE